MEDISVCLSLSHSNSPFQTNKINILGKIVEDSGKTTLELKKNVLYQSKHFKFHFSQNFKYPLYRKTTGILK